MSHNQNEINEITLENVTKEYDNGNKKQNVIKGISTTFFRQKSYALTGVSGSGKSTLMHIIGALDEPTTGSVLYGKINPANLKQKDKEVFFNKQIGFIFQFHYLIKELSVIENVMLPGLISGLSKKESFNQAKKLLDYCGLNEKINAMPGTLSGGEQQRTSIARAIFNKPQFLLADEPTGNLDASNAQRIVELFVLCQKEWGTGLIICSHDEHVSQKMDHVYHLENGLLHETR